MRIDLHALREHIAGMTGRTFLQSALLIVFGGIVYWAVGEVRDWQFRRWEVQQKVAMPARVSSVAADEALLGNDVTAVDAAPSPPIVPISSGKVRVIRSEGGDNTLDE